MTMASQTHDFQIRIYFEDTDAGGIVYHARYLQFADRARTEMLRQIGFNQSEIKQKFVNLFVVRRAIMDFHKSAYLDDKLTIKTMVQRMNRTSFHLCQNIFNKDTLLCAVKVILVTIGENGKPISLPARIKAGLERFFDQETHSEAEDQKRAQL